MTRTRMREVRVLRHFPWLILFTVWLGGVTLWLLFVNEQQLHWKVGFRSQLERLSDELFRSRLEGRLGPDTLPEGVRTFAIYGPDGKQAASWGLDAPEEVSPVPRSRTQGGLLLREHDGWVELVKVLQPLRPQWTLGFDGDDQPDPRMGPPPDPPRMMMGPRNNRLQGYLFLRVSAAPLEGRILAWALGGGAGTIVWTGFLIFVGVLWLRTRSYQEAMTHHRELLQFAEASRTLSHELQNPLAAILLQTALLRRTSGTETAPEVLIIEEEAQRMSGLVTRVREFLKDPRGQTEVLDLAELCASLQGRFAVQVTVELDGAAPFPVRFDAHRLRSVVENLMKNAVESGPEPQPRVRLSRPRPGWIRLEVLDSGSGFSAESLKRAFDPFFTTKTKGTGIGLAIADGFVKAAGGKLKLENRPERGAKVTLDLPEALETNP